MSVRQRLTKMTNVLALTFLAASIAFGQQTTQTPASRPGPSEIRQRTVTPSTAATTPQVSPSTLGLVNPTFLTPIYGLQGVLAETTDGATLAAQSVDDRFNPASSI